MKTDNKEGNPNDSQSGNNFVSKENEFKIFNSFKEAEDEHNKWLASLTPEQHLQNAVQLIKRLYDKVLKLQPELGNNFIID